MMNSAIKVFLFFLFCWASNAAHAQNNILFIDLNNAVPEIERLEKWLKHEQSLGRELDTKITVVPSYNTLSLEKRKKIHELHVNNIDKALKKYLVKCKVELYKNNKKLESECDGVLLQVKEWRAQKAELMGIAGNPYAIYDKEKIYDELKKTLSGADKFSRVIVSGHHGPDMSGLDVISLGYLSGELTAGVNTDELKLIMNDKRSLANVRTMLLAGCRTGQPALFQPGSGWAAILPQTPLKIGFVGDAPQKFVEQNLKIFDSVLVNEFEMSAARGKDEAQRAFKMYDHQNIPMGILVNGVYVNDKGVIEYDPTKPVITSTPQKAKSPAVKQQK